MELINDLLDVAGIPLMKRVVSNYNILLDVIIKINLLTQDGDDCLDSFPRVKHVEIICHISIELRLGQEIVVNMGYVSGTLVFLGPLVNHGRRDSYADNDEGVILFIVFAAKNGGRKLLSNFVEIRALKQPKLLDLILNNIQISLLDYDLVVRLINFLKHSEIVGFKLFRDVVNGLRMLQLMRQVVAKIPDGQAPYLFIDAYL